MTALTTVSPEPGYRADLRRARQALLVAELADSPADRFLGAHLAALRVAAALLGVAAQRTGRSGPADVWQVLVRVVPEYAEWAAFFAATRGTWQAVSAGARNVVTERMADDLLRDATTFCDEVTHRLDGAWRRRWADRDG